MVSMKRFAAFYAEAEAAIKEIANRYELDLPQGHAVIEEGALHWRLTAYGRAAVEVWARNWMTYSSTLGLGLAIEPGDIVIDQQGRTWTLLGLDVSAPEAPVRLLDDHNGHYLAPLSTASNLQLLVKKSQNLMETGQ